ncbi:MAG TPA: recombination mediator RecR [Chitinophagaceae bacterium]|nr:recombination mediator RecR [Chitinophagaceae bacterium]
MHIHSTLLDNAVTELSKLPSIGKKTALRLVLHLLKKEKAEVEKLAEALINMRNNIQFCSQCGNISDEAQCSICLNPQRQSHTVCIVESIRDVIAIENTQQYNGVYHVLGGLISPLDGVGPDQLNIECLLKRIQQQQIDEIIFAISPTIQGDTTIFYIQKKLQAYNITTTSIARGIAFGGELEYADEMTLAKSIRNRLPVNQLVNTF